MINTKFRFVEKKNAQGPIEGLVLERIVFIVCLRRKMWNCSKLKKVCLFSAQIVVIFESNKLNKVM